jgi:hypothetical protein
MEKLDRNRLESMTKPELITYANMTFGANVNSKMNKDSIIQTIERSTQKFAGNNELSIGDEDVLKPGYARIKINKTEINKSGRPIILSLNGKAASLPVGIEITVPMSYVEILNNAVQYRYEVDPANDNELVRQDVHSYPFTVIEMAKA